MLLNVRFQNYLIIGLISPLKKGENNMFRDETGLILCYYCEEEATISITGIGDMYLCDDAECAKNCLYDNIGEEPIEY